jgi:hypothetical protein
MCRTNRKASFEESQEEATVKAIERDGNELSVAKAGDSDRFH